MKSYKLCMITKKEAKIGLVLVGVGWVVANYWFKVDGVNELETFINLVGTSLMLYLVAVLLLAIDDPQIKLEEHHIVFPRSFHLPYAYKEVRYDTIKDIYRWRANRSQGITIVVSRWETYELLTDKLENLGEEFLLYHHLSLKLNDEIQKKVVERDLKKKSFFTWKLKIILVISLLIYFTWDTLIRYLT